MAKPTAKRKPRTNTRPTELLRRDILEAGLTIFARDGYDGASLMDIAARADTRHPLLLYHFGNKENLWRQVMAHVFEELKAHYSAVVDLSRDLSALDSLKMFIRAFVQFSARHPDRVTLVLSEMRGDSERLEWLNNEYMVVLHSQLNALFDRVEAENRLKAIPRANLVLILIGSVSTYFMAEPVVRRVYNVDPQTPDNVSAHADWIIEMLTGGLIRGD
jgi:TetR/AcrR family transcriptional regulator